MRGVFWSRRTLQEIGVEGLGFRVRVSKNTAPLITFSKGVLKYGPLGCMGYIRET